MPPSDPVFFTTHGEFSPTTLSPPSSTSDFSDLLDANRSASPPPSAELEIGARQGEAATPRDPFSKTTLARDSTFYFEEDMIEIRIEETLFRIPRTVLTLHSEYFKSMFHRRDVQGDTHEPLHLRGAGIKAVAFRNLLHVLYPPAFGKVKIASVDEWAPVLDLSTKWGFTAVRALAVERLVSIASPVEKIALARIYKLDHWLEDAYTAVCQRPEPLTLEEMRRLALEDVAKICEAREAARGGLLSQKVGTAISCALGTPVAPSSKAQKTKAQRFTTSGVASSAGQTLPLSEVLEVVERSLALLSDRDPDTQHEAQDDIVDAVRHSDKHGGTLRHIFKLMVTEGMKSLPGEGTPYAAVCDAIANMLGPDYKDHTLANSSGQPLSGREATVHYINHICEGMVNYVANIGNATNSDTAMRQAGFCADLFTRKLVDAKFVYGWWDAMNLNTYRAITANIRNYHAFLSVVGHLIDLPEVQQNANNVFAYFGSSGYYQYNSWNETRSEIQGLTALRARKWSKS